MKKEFPQLVSYNRFVRLQQSVIVPMYSYLHSKKGENTGISYIDSTSISVCHNRRINRNKVFSGIAARGRTTMGWFYGLKLHLTVNEQGELLGFCLTPGNAYDRSVVEKITKHLTGKLFGDKGYLSKKLGEQLMEQGLQLITSIRKI